MRLFEIPCGLRVRLTSKLIRWVEHHIEHQVGINVTWEGTTTNRYFHYKGEKRRLIVNHSIDWPEYGIWQKDTECEVLDLELVPQPRPRLHHGVLVDDEETS